VPAGQWFSSHSGMQTRMQEEREKANTQKGKSKAKRKGREV